MTKVLIVDDEPIVREAIQDWLVDVGYDVAVAETGEEALETLAEQDFDVIVLDVRLPGKTGIRVLQELREVNPNVKAIVITAYASPEMRAEAMRQGAICYMVKPISPDELEKVIRETVSSNVGR